MSGTKLVLDVAVIPGALVGILDEQADRRAGRLAFEYAGQDLHLIGLVALRRMALTARAAAIEVDLDVGLAELHARRTAVDDAAQRPPMALAKGRYTKQLSETIA